MPSTRSKGKSNRRRRQPTATWIVVGVAVLAVLAIVVVRVGRQASSPGERFASQGNTHIADVTADHPPYNSDPPTSGWHVDTIAPWGAYDRVMPDELLVHNMEDGGVVMWYALGSPEQNQQRVADLQDIARGFRNVVIAPRAGMSTPYALTAWQRLQRFEGLDSEAMRAFLQAYEGVDHHPG